MAKQIKRKIKTYFKFDLKLLRKNAKKKRAAKQKLKAPIREPVFIKAAKMRMSGSPHPMIFLKSRS